jgi:hypothetical protein
MSDTNQPGQAPQPNQPTPAPYQLPPDYRPPAPRSGLPGWAIALIIAGVVIVVLCVAGFIGAVGVLTLLGSRVSSVFSQINSGLVVPTSAPLSVEDALAIGQTAELSSLRITVTAAHPLAGNRGTSRPRPGYEYWAVEARFENTSRRPLTLSTFTTSVQDAAGKVYRYNSAAQRASPDPGLPIVSSVRPGEKVQGLLFYEVPADASSLFWLDQELGEQAIFKIK